MKKILHLLITLSFSNLAFSQIEWAGNFVFSEGTTDLLRTETNRFILVHGDEFPVGNGITVFDSLGNVVFSQITNDYIFSEGASMSEILETPDSGFVFSAVLPECDVIANSIAKYDKNWNLLWMNYDTWTIGPGVPLSDGSTVFCSYDGNALERRDANGQKIWSKWLSDYHILDLAALPGDTLLAATREGLLMILPNGTPAAVYAGLLFDRLEAAPSGHFLALHGDSLFLLSSSFEKMAVQTFPGEEIQDFTFNEDQVGALVSPNHVYLFDSTLQPTGDFSGDEMLTSFVFTSDGILAGGTERYGSTTNGNHSAFIKNYGLDGSSVNFGMDAGVVSLEQGGETTVTDENGGFWVHFRDMKAIVRNFGSVPIQRVNLNVQFPGILFVWECIVPQEFSKNFENLSLQPGGTVELIWDSLSVWFQNDPAGTLEFCVWTSLPNHKLDDDAMNDTHCTGFSVNERERLPAGYFSLFPNPTKDESILQFPTPAEMPCEVFLTDCSGRILQSHRLAPGIEKLVLKDLKPGFYFISLGVEGKIVKTEKLFCY